ncbi:unnamed protein product [Mytilus coruscus]|uniref:Uncharacterized protein n=1 Tax=Mytilus coruscus TaxID=42192 RepID=A0A6J8ANA1_MYTCO|nr:unnamed protein product [Mytilus coruscus]
MAEKHFNEFSYKTVRKSSNFLHSVWQPTQKLDIEANIYHDYYKIGNYNYVNDFSNNCWKKTSELSHEQVVCIHEDNKEKAYENNTSHFKSRVYGIDKNSFDSSFSSDSIISIPSSEMEVTDEFLDSLHIPKGKRGERITLMKKQSELFSRFLSLHIGTERIVKLRQLLLNKFVNIADTLSFEIIGSRSEGLDMTGSDTDILVVTNLTAHESGEHLNNSISTVEYDSLMDGIHPGYVILEDIASSNEMHTCLDESKKIINQFFKSKPHGPALMQSVLGADYDYVISIKSESWPKIAMEWINRNRQYGWPPQEMIYSIVQKGCHIVPVGSSRNHAEDKDWRLSFPMIDYCPRSYSYLLRSFCYFKLGDAQRCEHEYNEMKLVCDTYCGNLKTMHQTSNFILKLICDKVRHNINFDFSNKFEAARVLNQHSNEFDVTLSEIEDFLRNASELIIHSGLSSEVIDDFISDGTPTERKKEISERHEH